MNLMFTNALRLRQYAGLPTCSYYFTFLFWIAFLAGCKQNRSEENHFGAQPSTSSYVDQVSIKYAKGFQIAYFDRYKVLSIINSFSTTKDTLRYLLIEKGAEIPIAYKTYPTISIPITKLIATSSTHIGLLGFLEAEDILTGLSDTRYIYSPKVIRMVANGKVANVGKGQGTNDEKIIELHPDLVMTSGGPTMKANPLFAEVGIPVLFNSEWAETTPLARAEWVKLMAALLNQEKKVNDKFGMVEAQYQSLKELTSKRSNKPTIISGLNTKDVWFMPSGSNFMSAFFIDAGGNYLWSQTQETGSLALSFEAVYPIALKADFWLNVGFNSQDSKKSISLQDSRYIDFQAFKSGNIYSYNRLVNEQGSNDFFESGIVSPHLVLSDLIKILHPELLTDHQLVYYKRLE